MTIKVPKDMNDTWPCWRLVADDKASFTEVTEKMNLLDVMILHEAINAINRAANTE